MFGNPKHVQPKFYMGHQIIRVDTGYGNNATVMSHLLAGSSDTRKMLCGKEPQSQRNGYSFYPSRDCQMCYKRALKLRPDLAPKPQEANQ